MPGPEDRIEAEWQFDTDDLAPVESWLNGYPDSSALRLTRETPDEHLDIYYDTADWRFHRAGYALRLRRRNAYAELTLKSLVSRHSDLAARRELTEPLAPADDFAIEQAAGPVGERVRALRGRVPLIPLFSAITRRQIYAICADDRRVADLALDHTTFIGDTFDDQSQLLRVEIESTDGKTDGLEPFVAELRDVVPLEPATNSKYATGLARNRLAPVAPPPLDGQTFERDASIREVAYATLWRQLTELLRHEPGTRLGDDIEELHDMRVAVRRLRAALSLFKSFLPPEILALRDDLRSLAHALGDVRDLDVQLSALGDWPNRLDETDALNLDALLQELRRRRTVARGRMLETLDSERYERFISSFTELLAHPIDANSPAALEVAPDLILRRQRKFARKADRIKHDSPAEAFHAVRIEAKRLRYALEFFGPLYGKGATGYVRRLVAAQNLLGAHQDAIVAIEQLRELATDNRALPGRTLFVMGRIAERYAGDACDHRSHFPKTYRALGEKSLTRLRQELRAGRREVPRNDVAPVGDAR